MIIKVTYNVTDVYMSTTSNPIYINVSYGDGDGGASVWGQITGTLSDQTDLQTALDGKFDDPTGTTSEYIRGDGSLATFPTIGVASEVSIEVRNNSGSTITKGSVVYINGALGNKPTIAKAIATGDSTSAQTLGVVKDDINNNTQGYVVVIGKVENLDTSAYSEGTQLYLSPTTAGAYTSTKPYAPQHLVYVGIVTRQHPSLGVIEVNIQNGYELAELHDVDALNPNNNDGIFYNSTNELWEHKSIASVLGYTPGQGTVTSVAATAGTGISISGSPITSSGTLTITNTAPDQTVSLTQGGTTTITGTYPNFTISSADQFTGTVTSVGLTSSTSGVTITGSPITTSGSLTLDIATASGSATGLLSSTDWTTFNNKQNALTNPVTGTGASGQVAYWSGTNTQTGSNNLFWDSANNRLGIGTNTPVTNLEITTSDTPTFRVASTGAAASNAGRAAFTIARIASGAETGWQFLKDANDHFIFRSISAGSPTARMGLFTSGNVLIQSGGTFTDSGQRLQVQGTAFVSTSVQSPEFFTNAGTLLIRNTFGANEISFNSGAFTLRNTGATFTIGNVSFTRAYVGSTFGFAIYNIVGTWTGTQTLGVIIGFEVNPNISSFTLNSGSQYYGFRFNHTSVTGTGFVAAYVSNLNSAIDRWNLYMNGTAANYLAGVLNIGTTTLAGFTLDVNGTARVQGDFTLSDTRNIIVGTTTGTKIGTATSQKIGFWNATPDVQPTTAITAAAFVANTSGIVDDTATFGGYTIGQIVAALKRIGALA